MKILQHIVITAILLSFLGALPVAADATTPTEQTVRDFFEDYLSVYNRRFANPEGDDLYQAEIVNYLHTPLVMFPATGRPAVLDVPEKAAANFAGFTQRLASKGVKELVWHDMQIKILSPTKALANNTGHGVNAEGDVVYETVSVYSMVKSDDGWRIHMLSPYLVENRIDLQ